MHACDTSKADDRTSVRTYFRGWPARAFASPQQNRERKEASPQLGSRKPAPQNARRIALGSLLLAAHTSMRFGDIQRIRVRDISLTRGSCWATKTTKLGQPWACTKIFLGAPLASQFEHFGYSQGSKIARPALTRFCAACYSMH